MFSGFMLTFAMSLMILLVFICSTKPREKSDMAKDRATFCCSATYREGPTNVLRNSGLSETIMCNFVNIILEGKENQA